MEIHENTLHGKSSTNRRSRAVFHKKRKKVVFMCALCAQSYYSTHLRGIIEMNYKIITLFVLSFIIVSAITFDDAFAESGDISLNLSPPTLEFIQTEYIHNEMIPAKCISDDPKPTNSITWIIIDADTERPYLFSTVNGSAEYSFKAWFPEGDYKIKCKTNFVGGHNESEWKSFSIVSGIVDFAQYKKTKASITYDPPTIIFDERDYTQDETITATCIPDDSKATTNIIWFIILTGDNPIQFKYPHESADYSFPADRYEEGNYTIKCRTNFGDGHTKSIDGKFSIIADITTQTINPDQFTNESGGGGCSGDCTAPTIGVDKNGIRFVEDGLKLNGVSFDGNYFKNHMPMQYTEIGKINHLSLKVYENSGIYNIEKIQFGIVKETGSPINLAEPRIEIDVSNFANDIENASLDGFTLIDKEEIINYYDVSVSIVPCMDQSTQECLELDIYWSFAQVPEFNVLLINGWDNNKNSFNNYFNDGLTVEDPSPVILEIEEKYVYKCNDPPLEDIQVWTRINCNFAEYKLKIAQEALEYLENIK